MPIYAWMSSSSWLVRSAAQPALFTCRPRPTASASAGTSSVMQEAAPDIGSLAEAHRRDQGGVAADEDAILDDGRVFTHSVVVAGDRPGADVHALTDFGVAKIGEVVGFGSLAQPRLLGFDEIADVGALRRYRCPDADGSRGRALLRCAPPSLRGCSPA